MCMRGDYHAVGSRGSGRGPVRGRRPGTSSPRLGDPLMGRETQLYLRVTFAAALRPLIALGAVFLLPLPRAARVLEESPHGHHTWLILLIGVLRPVRARPSERADIIRKDLRI